MKALLEAVPLCPPDASFLVREFDVPYFEAPLHFHPVFELTLITASHGKRLIGDHVGDFDVGDLVLMGPDVPHIYRCAPAYYAHDPAARARALIIQFAPDFLGPHFFALPELQAVRELLARASRGLRFWGQTQQRISRALHRIRSTHGGLARLTQLMQLLELLAASTEYELLASQALVGHNSCDTDRLHRVYERALSGFQGPIDLAEVAALVHLSPSAFCRYFKKRTRKTFVGFLSEIRLGHARKLLLANDRSITDICYASGFQNLSNFNRQFKAQFGLSPSQFRQQTVR